MTRTGLRRVVACAAIALLAAACASSPPEPVSMRDSSVDFAKFKTFGWVTPGGATTGQPLGLLDQNLRAAISAELNARGYVAATEKPDLLITYEAAKAQKIESNPVRVGIGVGGWSGNVGGSVNVGSPSVRNYQEGSLVIHAIDAERNAEVWQGQLSAKLSKGGADPAAVRAAVGKAMKDFPARPAGQ